VQIILALSLFHVAGQTNFMSSSPHFPAPVQDLFPRVPSISRLSSCNVNFLDQAVATPKYIKHSFDVSVSVMEPVQSERQVSLSNMPFCFRVVYPGGQEGCAQ